MLASISAETSDDIGSDCGNGVGREIKSALITVRAAKPEDILAFYKEPARGTMRALVAVLDGNVVGVIGIVREQLWGRFFSDFAPALQPYLKTITIMRAVKQSLRFCDDYRGPVVAIAKDAESCRFMHRLGFTHLQGAAYAWLN